MASPFGDDVETTDVIVIGCGVMATACAYHPAHAGLNVTLLERRAIAAEASGGSTGGVRQQNRDPADLPRVRV